MRNDKAQQNQARWEMLSESEQYARYTNLIETCRTIRQTCTHEATLKAAWRLYALQLESMLLSRGIDLKHNRPGT